MTAREAEIMAMIDAGKRPRDVAAKLQVSPGYINRVVSLYRGGDSDYSYHRRLMAQGSAKLLDALQQAGLAA